MNNYSTGTPVQEPSAPASVRISLPLAKPLWSYAILGTIVLIWLAMEVLGVAVFGVRNATQNTQFLILFGAKYDPAIAAGQWWRLLTAMFLHAGLLHILFNAYALFQLGPEVERLFNRNRFLVIYFLSGLFGSLASYAFSPAVSVGASGAIFGLVGALIAYMRRYRSLFGRFGQQYLANMLIIVAVNFALGLSGAGIDNWGHAGGLVSGYLIGEVLRPVYAPPLPGAASPVLQDTLPASRSGLVLVAGLVALVAGILLVTSLGA